MDQNALVKSAHQLISLLDQTSIKPRAAMWVQNDDIWRLWLVPQNPKQDTNEFYRIISERISANRASLHGIDISDVEMVAADHPAIQGLSKMTRMTGLNAAHFTNNRLNGYFLPDGILLRMDLAPAPKPKPT